jgi:tRNA wybutosine-synthesizing protein 2
LNLVSRIVKPVLGDNRELAGEGIADRVIMGYVKTTHEHLPAAVRLVRDGGIIHYHETCPNELLPRRPVDRLMAAVGAGTVDVLRMKEIKSYAPGVSHVVLDVRVTKRA